MKNYGRILDEKDVVTKEYLNGILPSGIILVWSGAAGNIPQGWALCDGQNNTPDLRNRFVLGGSASTVGITGGEERVTLNATTIPKHSHREYIGAVSDGSVPNPAGMSFYDSSKGVVNVNKGAVIHADAITMDYNGATGGVYTGEYGSGSSHNNMPPYYTLCYIMKIA